MTEKRDAYFALGYIGDFGLTGLAEELCSPGRRSGLGAALETAAELADRAEGEEAVELGEDARRLLASPIPDKVLHTVWLAAVGRCFDPAAHGMDIRAWLEKLSEVSTDRLRQNKRSYTPPPVQPVREEELCRAVVAEIRGLSAELDHAAALPDLASSLEEVVTRADADLGLRLFLRVLKVYAVPVEKERYDRLFELRDHFGYHAATVHDGLNVIWPQVGRARQGVMWDFGLPKLARRFEAGWHSHTPREIVEDAAAADGYERTPGSEALLLLEDALRLLESDLSSGMVTTVWLAASGRGYDLEYVGVDGRQWLNEIAEVCRERLRDVAPAYTPSVPSAVTDLTESVLRVLREVTPAAGGKVLSANWRPLPSARILDAVEQVVTRVDPDLGFRLFLQALSALSVPLTEEQYARFEAIGRQFGYSEEHVTLVDHLVQSR